MLAGRIVLFAAIGAASEQHDLLRYRPGCKLNNKGLRASSARA